MPNKPWLIDRKMNKNKPFQITAWFFARLLNRLLNSIPLRIRIGERVLSHRYLLEKGETLSRKKPRILGYAGILLDEGGLSDLSRQNLVERRSDYPIFFDKPLVRAGEYFFHASNTPYNYFHFLYDFVIPLFIEKQVNPELKVYLPFTPAPWQLEWLSLIGQDDITHAKMNGNFAADSLVGMRSFLGARSDFSRELAFYSFREFLQTSLSFDSPKTSKESIYVFRKKSATGRNLTNQQELFSTLLDLGFHGVDLDRLTVMEQLTVFRNAKVIVSPHDAALSNLIAAQRGSRVIELLPVQDSGVFDMYKTISRLAGLEYNSVLSFQGSSYEFGADFRVSVSRVTDLLSVMPEPNLD
jgi:capsular polysaccharide biosynthesis protein